MTKKPRKLRGGYIQGTTATPRLPREMDAARATLWAQQIGLNLQKLRTMTLDQLARHISRNTAWGAIEVPSYVLATLAVDQAHRATAAAAQQREGRYDRTAFIIDDYEVADGLDGPMTFETDHIPPLPELGIEPPHEVRSCGCQVNAPHLCGKRGT